MYVSFRAFAKLTKKERELYAQCMAHCSICFYEDGCELQKKLSK